MTTSELHNECLAAVFHTAGQGPILTRVERPTLKSGCILVRITCCTVCGSDLHTFTGRRSGPTPCVLGHEIVGIVEAVEGGPIHDFSGNPLQPGDRVTWSVAASCGHCHRCSDRLPQKCESLFKYGHEHADRQLLSGGLASHCILEPGTAVIRLPDAPADSVICPANCATATVAAAVARAEDLQNRRVLVFGAGLLGLTTCAFAAVAGASEIRLCDPNEQRRAAGPAFGATSVSDSAEAES